MNISILKKTILQLKTLVYQGTYSLFFKNGYYLLRKHYFLPIPEESEILSQKESALMGIDMNESTAFDLLENIFNKYKKEFNSFPVNKTDNIYQYYLLNGSFMAIDGNVYYSFIRHLKPNKIVEIGSGNSTLLAAQAILRNIEESGKKSELFCIEPYPGNTLQKAFPDLINLIKEPVQNIKLEFFESLGENDILFIDSTHVLKSGGDVWYEYCEILPRLKSGVYVHSHDISLPKPYPKIYFDNQLFWNEQYVLQAFLTYNSKFEVVWGGNYLVCKYPEKICSAFSPEYDLMRAQYPSSEPTSFWLRVK